MISSLLGKKIGMTQVYDSANCLVPVTVVEAGPCSVIQVKTTETDGYNAVQIRVGDGSRGWAERAPYDKIVVTAAANEPPPALLQQLKPGGRMVLPIGADEGQVLAVVDKDADGRIRLRESISVRFTRLETVI